ncbi:DUF1206 domain-containing protein [Halomonas shantousis]
MANTTAEEMGIPAKFSWIARLGYAARGVVYFLVGGLALWSAFAPGGKTTDSKGALTVLIDEPFGQTCLALIGAGLVGYSLWRFVQGIADADHHGWSAKAVIIRASLIISGLIHLSLALTAFRLVMGNPQQSSEGNQGWTAQLMQHEWGRWLVALIGIAVVAAGLAQGIKGWRATFMKHFKVSRNRLGTICHICRFGLLAKGLVFGMIGLFLISAAFHYDSSEAKGLAGVFDALRTQPYGTVLLVIVSLGLLSFAVYSFIEARYRRVESP